MKAKPEYFDVVDRGDGALLIQPWKKVPLDPPFDLDARDESRPRRKDEAAHIWTAYEALVAEAKERLRVVTSEEIVEMAEEGR